MIQDHMKIWLLYPGFTLEQFGELPEWLDETDERPAAEQLGERWRPIEGLWQRVLLPRRTRDADGKETKLMYPALRIGGEDHRLLGVIHLRHDLLALFENSLVAIVKSEPSSGASPFMNGVFDVGRVELRGVEAPAAEAAE
jgi:hypothetical protein